MDKWIKNSFYILLATQLVTSCSSGTVVDKKEDTSISNNVTLNKNKPGIKLLNSSQVSELTNRISKLVERHSSPIEQLRTGVNAKNFNSAFYDDAWLDKVVQVGNIHYPHAAVNSNITGKVILEVPINADGSLFNIIVLKSSGHKILDAAATKIVNLAAPFAPLPPEILAETSIYTIIRVWRFQKGKSIF